MTRAMHEIQYDAMRLVQIKLLSAIEANAWTFVKQYASELAEIADRGLYHAAQERQAEVSAFAMKNYKADPEAR